MDGNRLFTVSVAIDPIVSSVDSVRKGRNLLAADCFSLLQTACKRDLKCLEAIALRHFSQSLVCNTNGGQFGVEVAETILRQPHVRFDNLDDRRRQDVISAEP